MVAITAEEGQVSETDVGKWALGSGNSAFTRISPMTPKKDEEEQSTLVEQLAALGEALSVLTTSISQLQQLKDREQEQLQETVASLQRELHSLTCRHMSEVADLREQVASLQAQVEKDTVALKHKAQEEKTLKKLCSEMDENRELFEQHRSENKELRREVSELRRSLQQARLEGHVLRKELSSSQSGASMPALEEKILMHKEVDKLRRNLAEAEDSRSKLLERAKRHQLVHESNQRKLECELLVLDQMIETVRETLSSIPAVVKDCEKLQRLVAYLG
ncbi:sperm-associated antigen 5 [Megalops cyprinoides]|uniref:sperm-associated antigen 5 n=1 Tax=Megalops cyprinoides TaxID=118141 RepID=UPI001863B62E|nr:sperm-associated antigen 5 [Megalops cyprinoides]